MRRCMQGGGSSTCAKMKPGAAQSRCVDMAQGSTYAMLWARTPALLGHLRRFASCCARRSQTRQLLLPKTVSKKSGRPRRRVGSLPWSPSIENSAATRGFDATRAAARALGQPKKASSTRLRRRRDAPGAHEELPSRRRDRGAAGGQLPTSRRRAPWPSSRRRAPPPSASPSM